MFFQSRKLNSRCPYCFSQYLPGTQVCPICRQIQRNSAHKRLNALPIDTILVGRFRLGIVLKMASNSILYAAWDLKRNRQVFIQELFMEDYMLRQENGSVVLRQDTPSISVLLGETPFWKTRKNLFQNGGTYYTLVSPPIEIEPEEEISQPAFQCHAAVYSDIGVRTYQEDAADVIVGQDFAYGILCDGMGGMGNGALASAFCLSELRNIYRTLCFLPVADIWPQLEKTIRHTDKQIAELQDSEGRFLHCGTTLVCAVIRNSLLYYASVGDSRLYRISGNTIQQLTQEHTLLHTLLQRVEEGDLTYEQAMANPNRDALTSYIGVGNLPQLDLPKVPISLTQNDILLLCSDGLYRALSDEEILSTLIRTENTSTAAQLLVAEAIEKQLPQQDNLTAVVIQFMQKTRKEKNS